MNEHPTKQDSVLSDPDFLSQMGREAILPATSKSLPPDEETFPPEALPTIRSAARQVGGFRRLAAIALRLADEGGDEKPARR